MKKFLCSLLTLGMLVVGLGVMPVNAEDAAYPITMNGKSYETLLDAFDDAPASLFSKEIILNDNIVIRDGEHITNRAGRNIVLNLNGHTVTFSSTYDGTLITNEGTLTIKGNGTIDASNNERATKLIINTANGIISNKGLTIENGTFKTKTENSTNCITNQGKATIYDGYFFGATALRTGSESTTTIKNGTFVSEWYPAVDAEGTITVENGTFKNDSCSSCDPNHWGYAFRSRKDLTFKNGTVIGTQGALAIAQGTATIENGHFETVACPEHGDRTAFYALYVAGEWGNASATINGGTFISASKAAVYIGNGNYGGDGGIMENALCTINDGSFTTKGAESVEVVHLSEGFGTANIYGGTYCKAVNTDLIPSGYVQTQNENGTYTVSKQ